MANKKPTYHCDGFYFDKVCPSRGEVDVADIRYDNEGWAMRSRCFCKTLGMSPWDNYAEMCPHCVEHKKWFRAEPRVLTGHVVHVTPFQAKEEGTARTKKAFKTKGNLVKYLKRHGDQNTYGVEVNSGVLVR
jgi:hypothetical protein